MSSFPDFPGLAGGPNSLGSTASWLERTFCTGELAVRLVLFSIAIGIVCAWIRMRTPSVDVELAPHQYPDDETNPTKLLALDEVVIVSSESATSNIGLSTSTPTSQFLHQPSDPVDIDCDVPHTCAEKELELLISLVLYKEGANTFTSIGGQFDDVSNRQLSTNISMIEDDNEEIDLGSVEILSQDCLPSLMRKHEEDVWDFVRR